jgi:hypothetical protein
VYPLTQNEVPRAGLRQLSLASSKSMRTWYSCVFKYLSPFQLHLLSVFNTSFSPRTLKVHKLQTTSLLEGSLYGTESIGTVMRTFLPEGPVVGLPVPDDVLAEADVNLFDAFLNQLAEQSPESPPDVLPPLELAPEDEEAMPVYNGLPWAVQVAAKGPKAAKAAAMNEALDVIPAQDFEEEEEPPIFVGNLVRPRRRFAGPLPVSKNLDIRPFFEAPL